MATYVAMQPPLRPGKDPVTDVVFVRDRFSLLAFLLPPLWLAWHRAWIAAAMALLAAVLLGAVAERAGVGPAGGLLSLLVSIYVGLEGPALWLAALRRRGWRDAGVVEADSLADAEIRFFAARADRGAPVAAPPAQHAAEAAPRLPAGPALGLFAYPGKP